jgi:hypothetical protein
MEAPSSNYRRQPTPGRQAVINTTSETGQARTLTIKNKPITKSKLPSTLNFLPSFIKSIYKQPQPKNRTNSETDSLSSSAATKRKSNEPRVRLNTSTVLPVIGLPIEASPPARLDTPRPPEKTLFSRDINERKKAQIRTLCNLRLVDSFLSSNGQLEIAKKFRDYLLQNPYEFPSEENRADKNWVVSSSRKNAAVSFQLAPNYHTTMHNLELPFSLLKGEKTTLIRENTKLGQGSFGVVRRALGMNNLLYAVKVAKTPGEIDALTREHNERRHVNKESELIESKGTPNKNSKKKDLIKKAYLVMPLRGMNLRRFIKTTPTSNQNIKRYFKNIVDELAFMHSKKIIHRDIKLSNILMPEDLKDPSQKAELTDLGTAVIMRNGRLTVNTSSVEGTLTYLAPESFYPTLVPPTEKGRMFDLVYQTSYASDV